MNPAYHPHHFPGCGVNVFLWLPAPWAPVLTHSSPLAVASCGPCFSPAVVGAWGGGAQGQASHCHLHQRNPSSGISRDATPREMPALRGQAGQFQVPCCLNLSMSQVYGHRASEDCSYSGTLTCGVTGADPPLPLALVHFKIQR